MGCCTSRDSKSSSNHKDFTSPDDLSQQPTILSNLKLTSSERSIQEKFENFQISPESLTDHSEIQGFENDTEILTRIAYSEDLISNSTGWKIEYEDSILRIRSKESAFLGVLSDAIFQEITLNGLCPTSIILEALHSPIVRTSWDKNVTSMILKDSCSIYDMLSYTRIEYLFIVKKYVIERRVVKKYKDGIAIVFYSVDDKEVPYNISKNASESKVLAGVTYIYNLEECTHISIFMQSEPQPKIIKPVVMTCMKNWVYALRKYLEGYSLGV